MRLGRRWRLLGLFVGVALAGAGVSAALWAPPGWLLDLAGRAHPGCLYRVPVRAPIVALTIDDGPDPVTTPLITAELARHGARATFFLISSRIPGRESLVRDVTSAGHELGNHLTRDEPSIGLTRKEFEEALVAADRALAPYGRPRWARPGSGWYTRAMVETMRRHGYRCALGSVYPFDGGRASAEFAAGYILRNVEPGAIVVLHDAEGRGHRTARVLERVLPELRRRGYRVTTLSELLRVAASRPPAAGVVDHTAAHFEERT